MKASNHHRSFVDARLTQWMTRGLSLVVNLFYAVILVAAFTNEDPPTATGWAVLGCVLACIVTSVAAWRWPRVGGLLVLGGAAALAVSVIVSAALQGFEPLAAIITLFVYPVPAILVGALFVADGQSAR